MMKQRSKWLASVGLTAVVSSVAMLLVTGGIASGSSSSSQYAGPSNTAAPAITGTAQVGQTLTTSNGTWTGTGTITYTYAWSLCDTAGNNCTAITGATASTYTLVTGDQGHTVRSQVIAKDSNGSTSAQSAQTAVVTAAGTSTTSGTTVAATSVVLPDRLVIDQVKFGATPIRARKSATTLRVHVTDSANKSVSGALVYGQGLPYSRIQNMNEVSTDATGWATLSVMPGKFFPRTGYVVVFLRARVSGQDTLGGSSVRRLVQATVGAPNGT
jgi:hypothetical protein